MTISDLTKEQLQEYTQTSNNWKELLIKCGYTNLGCYSYLKKRLQLFDISTSHFTLKRLHKKYTYEDIFKENSTYSSMTCIKNKLINQYNWKYECSSCKLSEWMTNKIPLEIDHINGIHTDNRIENLRFLCPNCHALTDTYKGKNIKNKAHSKEKYDNIIKRKICSNCNNYKYKNSEYCKQCHIKIKLHTVIHVVDNKCVKCDKSIQKQSEWCVDCYKEVKKEGIFEKQNKNTKNTKKCYDCNNLISNKSLRCRLCHYSIMKLKSNTNSKERIKRQCIDCNTTIENRATRCVECHLINSRKVERPSYEQLIKDKEILNMVQIGKKYNVSDNTIRKWLNKYKNINNSTHI